jgi:hypothetical protein
MSDKSKIYNYIKRTINPYGRPFEGTVYEFGLKIMDFIENIDGEKENGWISVSERLPEGDTTVLVSCKTRRGTTFVRTGYCVDGSWHLNCEGVTAWKPLPEPYKED